MFDEIREGILGKHYVIDFITETVFFHKMLKGCDGECKK